MCVCVYGIMMVSFAIDFWLCDVLSSETPLLLPPEFGATFAIVANCDDGKYIAFECNSDVADFDAAVPAGHVRLATMMHGC